VTRYVLYFLGMTFALAAVVTAFEELTGFDLKSGVNMGITIGATLFAGHYFVKDHGRLPTSSERHKLAAYSLISSLVLAAAISAGSIWFLYGPEGLREIWDSELGQLDGVTIAIIAVVALGLGYLVLWICYGWLLRKTVGKQLAS
jgi:hypothetical protein